MGRSNTSSTSWRIFFFHVNIRIILNMDLLNISARLHLKKNDKQYFHTSAFKKKIIFPI